MPSISRGRTAYAYFEADQRRRQSKEHSKPLEPLRPLEPKEAPQKSDTTLAMIRKLWAYDMTVSQIADVVGVHKNTVTRWAREMGLPIKQVGPNPMDDAEFKSFVDDFPHMTNKELAIKYQRKESALASIANKHGLKKSREHMEAVRKSYGWLMVGPKPVRTK